MKVVEPLVAVVTAMKIYFIAVDSCRVVVAAGRLWTESFRFGATYQIVKVKHIQVVERLLPIPASKNKKKIADLVAGMSCTATWRVILW